MGMDFSIQENILVKYEGTETSVFVPDIVEVIASDAFREGKGGWWREVIEYRETGSLHEISIPSGVKTISSRAFFGCIALNRVILSEGIREIEDEAFSGCKALKNITIPKSVEHIGINAFKNCDSLSDIYVEEGNPFYSDIDGVLYNDDKTEVIFCPKGKKIKDIRLDPQVTSIADFAFSDCEELDSIYISSGVKRIGGRAFYNCNCNKYCQADRIHIEIGAGEEYTGEIVFAFCEKTYTYPSVPVTFPKEKWVRDNLALGFCQAPEKYSEEYAEVYRKYVKGHQKSLLKTATSEKLQKVLDYIANINPSNPVSGKIEEVNYKKLKDAEKVALLERVVLDNNIQQIERVLQGCGEIEFTARALGLACLYGNLDVVKTLIKNGISFGYEDKLTSRKIKQYGAYHTYFTADYSLMICSTDLDVYIPSLFTNSKTWHFGKLPEVKTAMADEETRASIARYLLSADSGFNSNAALYYAILWGCFPVAKALMDAGIKLSDMSVGTLTDTKNSFERNELLVTLAELPHGKCAEALEVFALAIGAENKIALTQKIYDNVNSSFLYADVMRVMLEKTDVSRLKTAEIIKKIVDRNDDEALSFAAQAGWIKTPLEREKLIKYAQNNQKTTSLAWLVDYKNRTADIAAETVKAEAKAFRELTEDPNSVSALKKIWSYKKLENGSLIITSYKGDATEVEIPEKIGKSHVRVIGERCFDASGARGYVKNTDERRKITRVVIPNGVTEIQSNVFIRCGELREIVIPDSVRTISSGFALYCCNLVKADIPAKAKVNGDTPLFDGCISIYDNNELIISNGRVLRYNDKYDQSGGVVAVPQGITEIVANAFKNTSVKKLILPKSLNKIASDAFYSCRIGDILEIPGNVNQISSRAFMFSIVKTIKLKSGVTSIGNEAFWSHFIEDIYIPASVTKLKGRIFNEHANKLTVHTEEGASVIEYVKQYDNVEVAFDYSE